MAATKPRVPVMLTPHQHDVLTRLAKTQGTSISKILGEIVESVMPPLERALVLAEAAQRASSAVRERLLESAEQAEQALMPIMAQGIATLEAMEADMHAVAGAAGAAAPEGGVQVQPVPHPQGGKKARRPPLVNKGVTPPSQPPKAPSRGRQRVVRTAG